MSKGLRLALSLLLSVVFLWFTFRNVDMAQVQSHLRQVDLAYVALFLVTQIVMHVARVVRWGVLLQPIVRIPGGTLWRISCAGLMLIVVLPLRLGELARPLLLKRETGASLSAGIATVAMERTIDGLLVTLLFFVMVGRLDSAYDVPAGLRVAAVAALAVFSGAVLVIVLALATHGVVPRVLRRVGHPVSVSLTERVLRMLDSFVSGLRSLPRAGAFTAFTGWTLLYWAANGWGLYLLTRGFGWDLPLVSGFVLVCILVIGIMIPAGPGFLGPFQAALVEGLTIFGVGRNEAVAYSLVAYPLSLAVPVVAGLPFVMGRGANVREIVAASGEMEAKAEGRS